MDTQHNATTTTDATDATEQRADPTQRAIDYLRYDASLGGAIFREVAYMGATLGRDSALSYMTYQLARYTIFTAGADYPTVYRSVFGPLFPREHVTEPPREV